MLIVQSFLEVIKIGAQEVENTSLMYVGYIVGQQLGGAERDFVNVVF